MGAVLLQEGFRCIHARTAAEASLVVAREPVHVIVLDDALPDRETLAWLIEHRRDHAEVPVVVATWRVDSSRARAALRAGAIGLLAKPCRAEDVYAQVVGALALRDHYERARHAMLEAERRVTRLPQALCERLLVATWQRDGETGAHVERIRRFSTELGLALGMPLRRATSIGEAALLHDIGKVAVPDAILRKPGPLDDRERAIMEGHAIAGARVLHDAGIPELALAATIARSHHERWDGTGYPDGLRGEQCPVEARLVAIVDVYDALSHARVYKPAWSPHDVESYFVQQRGRQFEPILVDALLSSLPMLATIREELTDEPGSETRLRPAASGR
jgi:putative two-component system response regulator